MTNIMTKTLRSSFLILAFSLFVNNASAQSCGVPPTCESLGYQQSSGECEGVKRVLKCPFDESKLFCVDSVMQSITIGAILYSDKTVTSGIVTGKTPIGIVFDTNKRLALALDQAGSTLAWESGSKYLDIPDLTNCTSEPLTCGTDGKANTSAIIAYGKANRISYPAAEYCNRYTTSGTQTGDWFLPSYAELKSIYNAKNYVNASLQLLGKSALTENYYWSSTEYNGYSSWKLSMYIGYNGLNDKGNGNYVRAVVAF